jgi:hypothetical protein
MKSDALHKFIGLSIVGHFFCFAFSKENCSHVVNCLQGSKQADAAIVTSRNPVEIYRYFVGKYCFHLQGNTKIVNS